MSSSLSLVEQETVILYNNYDKTCTVSTCDRSLIRKLNDLAAEDNLVRVVEQREGYAEYELPKKYVKVRPPRKMTEEQKQKAGERMRAMRKTSEDESNSEE
jgi:hypothetical protein